MNIIKQSKKYLAVCLALCVPFAAAVQKPNIIYILADDMGVGDVQFLNPQAKVNTPNINAIAEQGLSFTDMHTGSSVCTPNHLQL